MVTYLLKATIGKQLEITVKTSMDKSFMVLVLFLKKKKDSLTVQSEYWGG